VAFAWCWLDQQTIKTPSSTEQPSIAQKPEEVESAPEIAFSPLVADKQKDLSKTILSIQGKEKLRCFFDLESDAILLSEKLLCAKISFVGGGRSERRRESRPVV